MQDPQDLWLAKICKPCPVAHLCVQAAGRWSKYPVVSALTAELHSFNLSVAHSSPTRLCRNIILAAGLSSSGEPFALLGVVDMAGREAAEKLKAEGNAAFQKQKYGAAVDVSNFHTFSCASRAVCCGTWLGLNCFIYGCSDTQKQYCCAQTGQYCSSIEPSVISTRESGKM